MWRSGVTLSCERTVQLEIFRRFSNNSKENNHYQVSVTQARLKRGVLVIYKIKLFKTLTNKTTELYSRQPTRYQQPNKTGLHPNMMFAVLYSETIDLHLPKGRVQFISGRNVDRNNRSAGKKVPYSTFPLFISSKTRQVQASRVGLRLYRHKLLNISLTWE
jgi:hypothetical protein